MPESQQFHSRSVGIGADAGYIGEPLLNSFEESACTDGEICHHYRLPMIEIQCPRDRLGNM
jgi:hypothetical protein